MVIPGRRVDLRHFPKVAARTGSQNRTAKLAGRLVRVGWQQTDGPALKADSHAQERRAVWHHSRA